MVFAVPIADLLVLFLDHDFSKSNCEPPSAEKKIFPPMCPPDFWHVTSAEKFAFKHQCLSADSSQGDQKNRDQQKMSRKTNVPFVMALSASVLGPCAVTE
jgi:hypothetical protein